MMLNNKVNKIINDLIFLNIIKFNVYLIIKKHTIKHFLEKLRNKLIVKKYYYQIVITNIDRVL